MKMAISRIMFCLLIFYQLLNKIDTKAVHRNQVMTVHHYARHLCKTEQRDFYEILVKKFKKIDLSKNFAACWVLELCNNGNIVLDQLVAELFDYNTDELIDCHEREQAYGKKVC